AACWPSPRCRVGPRRVRVPGLSRHHRETVAQVWVDPLEGDPRCALGPIVRVEDALAVQRGVTAQAPQLPGGVLSEVSRIVAGVANGLECVSAQQRAESSAQEHCTGGLEATPDSSGGAG